MAGLGIATGYVGAVGDDMPGKMLLRDFESLHIDTSRIKIKQDAATGIAHCFTDHSGNRALYVSPGANDCLMPEDLDMDHLNQAMIIHFSSFTDQKQLDIQLDVIDLLSPSIMISFAPGEIYASRGLSPLVTILRRTHILFVNGHELELLTGEKLEKGVRICLEQGCKIVAVTLGKGLKIKGKIITGYLSDSAQDYMIESSGERKVTDTTGAGDAFAAGVLYGLLKEKNLRECGLLGETMAQFCIGEQGSRAGLPSLTELARRYHDRTGSDL